MGEHSGRDHVEAQAREVQVKIAGLFIVFGVWIAWMLWAQRQGKL